MARRRSGEGISQITKQLSGFSKRAADFLLAEFPEWRPYASAVPDPHDPDEKLLNISVPDPVEGRNLPLKIDTVGDEITVYWGAGWGHYHLSPNPLDEEKTFVECATNLRALFEEKQIWWDYWNEENSTGGGFGPLEQQDKILSTARKTDAGKITFNSWRGTFDKQIDLTKAENEKI